MKRFLKSFGDFFKNISIPGFRADLWNQSLSGGGTVRAPDFSDPTNARARTFTDELGRGHSLAQNGQIQIPSVPLAVLSGHTCPAPRIVPGCHHSLPPHRLCMEPPHSTPQPSLLVGLKVTGKSFLGPVLPGDPGRTGTGPGAEPKSAEYGGKEGYLEAGWRLLA